MQESAEQLDNQIKLILSDMLKNGSIVLQCPLSGKVFDFMRENGSIIEESTVCGLRYSLSVEFKKCLQQNRHILDVEESHFQGFEEPDFDFV